MTALLRLNRFELFAIAAVITTTALFFGAALDAASLYMSVNPMTYWQEVRCCVGWFVATFGPILLACAFHRVAKHLQRRWLLHVLLLPLAVALFKAGEALMLSITGTPDFDDTLGGPILQAMVLLLVSIAAYYAAVLLAALRSWQSRRVAS